MFNANSCFASCAISPLDFSAIARRDQTEDDIRNTNLFSGDCHFDTRTCLRVCSRKEAAHLLDRLKASYDALSADEKSAVRQVLNGAATSKSAS